ncbi:MAG: glycoside hydrolase family 127 protein [Fimbriimonadaceae bacterium]|nr:glycoside hydrolase family 127 protein [Fimbriimonadaceae bacterium]
MLAPHTRVRVTAPLVVAWQDALIHQGLSHQWRMCEETGRTENFRRVARGEKGGFAGRYYNDSDVYKLAEAAAYAHALTPEPHLKAILDEALGLVEGAQHADGYVGTFISLAHPDKRYLCLAAKHEMYCMGHLLEACCAAEEVLGGGRWQALGESVADHLVSTFGPGRRRGYGGHEEVEIGLARTARQFGRPGDLELSRWMTDQRGTRPSPFEDEINDPVSLAFAPTLPTIWCDAGKYDGSYAQDDKPLRDQTTAVGHAVRAMYQYCGAMDVYGGDDTGLSEALLRIWSSLTERRMYVTGGIGSSFANEGFTTDFDLPNRTAYAETCAGIGLCMWAARMGAAFGDGRFFDIFERSLFNGVLSGMDFAGTAYHYENPLESEGDHIRQPWFDCACCPPNIARFILSLGRYLVSWGGGTVSVDVPLAMEAQAEMSGVPVKVVVESEYPHKGSVVVRVHPQSPVYGTLRVRVPGTATTWSCPGHTHPAHGYLSWTKEWKDGDEVVLDLELRPEFLRCDPRVNANIGRVAVQRGPLVYCLEEKDLGARVQRFVVDESAGLTESSDADPRVGHRLHVHGAIDAADWHGPLYQAKARQMMPVTAALVPYATWGNRGQGSMQVWLAAGRA